MSNYVTFCFSQDMSTALTTLGPNQIGLMTVLGHHWVTGASNPPPGDGRYRLYGHTWESFQRRHQLKQGMILVFKKDPHRFNFEVFFYNADGSEATAISRKPAGFGPAGLPLKPIIILNCTHVLTKKYPYLIISQCRYGVLQISTRN